jgi:hypothetical protein
VTDIKLATIDELRTLLRKNFEQYEGDNYMQVYWHQIGCPKPVLLSDDNVLRSCLQLAKDKFYKNFTISLDSPAKEFSTYVWKNIRSSPYGVQEMELIPNFDIQPKVFADDERSVLDHVIKACTFKNKAYLLGLGVSEATKSSIVETFMVGAMQLFSSDMFLAQQHPMSGMRGHGVVDFAVIDRIHQTQVLGVTEVKKEDFSKGLAQNMVQLDVAVQQKKRKRTEDEDDGSGERPPTRFKSYGIVTDSFNWTLVECTLDEEDALSFRTKNILPDLDLRSDEKTLREGCERIFGYVLALYDLMKYEIVNRNAYGSSASSSLNPNKRISTVDKSLN